MTARRLILLWTLFGGGLFAGGASAARLKEGDPAPALGIEKLLQAPENAVASWEALRGKVVVVEFWATWCVPCIQQIPHMNELVEAFRDQPVQFLSVSDEDEATVSAFLKKRPMKPWIGLDTDQSMLEGYQVFSIPYLVLVDAKGQIAAFLHPAILTKQLLEDVLAGKPLAGR
jgi:thiol-disulfide isomerase/thioredoxin